ncbi:probable transcriptional regulatory protein At2g25830 [Amaranthus tricolor]|uniref:probable transcriptional regulatory protein At2g25830 n=1 Tax=Amaranthus tricolor TaxID=29722 RepID=UPI00258D711B|nr:probable transcriptional regulatory protein At2g25830 [Amaranthus tricolor]XP_057522969.1 probable transcriptional regulatory protein At2g25830 [Amaranthus tricolor]
MRASSSSIRALGTILHRFATATTTALFKSHFSSVPSPYSYHSRYGRIWKRFSSASPSSSNLWNSQLHLYNEYYEPCSSVRKIWTFSPLCMGRRACKIADRKGAQNLKKMKLYSKIGKEVVSAVKKGGTNPVSNTVLAGVIEKAKELDVPREIVERNIKKASDKGQEAFIEKAYEVYGFGGVGFVVEVSTDKVNRSVAAIREVVKDCGGKMADSGSVVFRFRRARIVNVKVSDADKDQLLEIALDAGAEDVIEPPDNEDDSEEDQSERCYKIVSSPEGYSGILSKLRDEGISFEPDSGYELLPITPIEVDDEAMALNKELMSELLALNDVDAVYMDQK